MNQLTSQHLKELFPHTPKAKRDRFLPFLNEAMPRYGITTELRVAAFLGTIGPESDWLKATEEYASGAAYEGRRGLGNTQTGDGKRFKGRGLIQTTGRGNYTALQHSLGRAKGVDFVAEPTLLNELYWAVESACFFWQTHRLNSLADKRQYFNIQGIVNRGSAGKMPLAWPERKACYERALQILPDDFQLGGVEPGDILPDDTDSDTANIPTTAPAALVSSASVTPVAGGGSGDVAQPAPRDNPAPEATAAAVGTGLVGSILARIGLSQEHFFTALDKIQQFPARTILLLGGVALLAGGFYQFYRARVRANQRTVAMLNIAADPQKINTEIVPHATFKDWLLTAPLPVLIIGSVVLLGWLAWLVKPLFTA